MVRILLTVLLTVPAALGAVLPVLGTALLTVSPTVPRTSLKRPVFPVPWPLPVFPPK